MLACILRNSRIDGAKHAAAVIKLLVTRLRQVWPGVRIIVRGDSGFCRQRLIREFRYRAASLDIEPHRYPAGIWCAGIESAFRCKAAQDWRGLCAIWIFALQLGSVNVHPVFHMLKTPDVFMQLVFLCLTGLLGNTVWAMPTGAFVTVTPGLERSFQLTSDFSDLPSFGYLGGRRNWDLTKRHILANQVQVNGVLTTVLRDSPQGYSEYWQFGGGAKLHRIDEGDYNDMYGIGVFNRQNIYTPAIPVISQDTTVGSTLSAQGTVARIYNSVVPSRTMQFVSQSVVTAFETVQLDGLAHQAFRVVTTIDQSDAGTHLTLTITSLFVEGVGLIPVQTMGSVSFGGGPATGGTVMKYTPFELASYPIDPITITARAGIPPGAVIDGVVKTGTNWVGNIPPLGAADVYVTNGQFAGQEYPPSSLGRLTNPSHLRVQAPTTQNSTACADLTIGPQSAGQFCVTSSDSGNQPQSGILSFSDWGDWIGVGGAEFHNFSSFNAMRGSWIINNVLNDKAFDLLFTDSGVNGNLHIAMPDNGWPRLGLFMDLQRSNASFGWGGRGCNESISNLSILDVQYDANQNITSIAVDIEQHCEYHPEAFYASLRYNSSVPFTTFSSLSMTKGAILTLAPGWNLLGNSGDVPVNVAALFANPRRVQSVWKWDPTSGKWAFYAPSMTPPDIVSFAANKGYDVLSTINWGEGFWVNAKTAFTAQLPAGAAILSSNFADQAAPPNNLPAGWSLIAIGDNKTPKEFVTAISVASPLAGYAPTSLTTLWAWDAKLSNWYFYAPSLENNGTLFNYIANKGYLDFGIKTLSPAMGFWVNHQ